ncbi:LytTR family transcriptional regulator [Ruegeria pomeroyi]|nr:LytTR family transcriptional regulator [Ruegeria pomeroyi]
MTSTRPLTLRFLNGDTVSLDRRAALTMMTAPIAMFMVVFSATIVRILSIFMLDVPVGWLATVGLGLGLGVVLWVFLLLLCLLLVRLGQTTRHGVNLPVPLIGLSGVLCHDIPLLWLYARIFDLDIWTPMAAAMIVLLAFAVHLGFELLFAAVMLPLLARADSPQMAPAGTPRPASDPKLMLAGETIAAKDITLVQADEHYVFVHHGDRKSHVRQSFGALVKALDDAAGMQVHKSYWVAFDHIQQVQSKRDGGLKLILKDKTAIPGARSRARAFREAFRSRTQRGGGRGAAVLEDAGKGGF